MIDVIIPAYNCNKTLGRTLASLVAQTDNDFIVTIVDDCSTENLRPIIDEYYNRLRISYVKNKKNLGCGMTRQTGIDNTKCSHFTFLDSDDMFMPYTVETFNSIVKANPDTEYIHSYIYEQTLIDGNPALTLHKDGFSYCHGKLYNREKIDKLEIKNSPLIKWHDDSYFNSMCSELLETQLIPIPTVLWTCNPDSITRKIDRYRDENVLEDFLTAMIMSKKHVSKHKPAVDHIPYTIEAVMRMVNSRPLTTREQELLKQLKEGES